MYDTTLYQHRPLTDHTDHEYVDDVTECVSLEANVLRVSAVFRHAECACVEAVLGEYRAKVKLLQTLLRDCFWP